MFGLWKENKGSFERNYNNTIKFYIQKELDEKREKLNDILFLNQKSKAVEPYYLHDIPTGEELDKRYNTMKNAMNVITKKNNIRDSNKALEDLSQAVANAEAKKKAKDEEGKVKR